MGMKKASKRKELEGVTAIYENEGFRVTLARAGGFNKPYSRYFEEGVRPFRRASETNTLRSEKVLPILQSAYAQHIIKNWEVLRPDPTDPLKPPETKWIVGIDDPDYQGEGDAPVLPFTKENVLKVISDDRFHDYWEDFVRLANEISLYLEDKREAETKN